MTDLHTHILAGMDDGAKDIATSLQMLRMEAEQGVQTVALTPHFERDKEPAESFLRRRAMAWEALQEAIALLPSQEQEALPRCILGAEVAWMPNMHAWTDLEKFCYADSPYLLLELPFAPWGDVVLHQLYDLVNQTDVVPVIAHLDRYLGLQKAQWLEEVLNLGVPVQFTAASFSHLLQRRKVLQLFEQCGTPLLISDCHDTTGRKPNVQSGWEFLQRKLGEREVRYLQEHTEHLLLHRV